MARPWWGSAEDAAGRPGPREQDFPGQCCHLLGGSERLGALPRPSKTSRGGRQLRAYAGRFIGGQSSPEL